MEETDQVLAPFYAAHLTYKETLSLRVGLLDDEELERVHDLFRRENYVNIPREFWLVAAIVRAHVRREIRRRREAAANETEVATA